MKPENKKDALRVYLAGTITTEDDYFQEWRVKASLYLRERGIIPLSPMAKTEIDKSKDGGITSNIPNRAIFRRDVAMVRSAHVILANLKVKGYSEVPVKKPIVGTYCEMMLANELGKPVVSVIEDDHYLHNNHPFVVEMTTIKFNNLEDALENIYTYWNWHHQAKSGE